MLGASAQGDKASVWEDSKVLEMDSDDRNKTMLMSLMTLNCTLKNGYKDNSVLYVFHLDKKKIFLIDQTRSLCSMIPRRPILSLIALTI